MSDAHNAATVMIADEPVVIATFIKFRFACLLRIYISDDRIMDFELLLTTTTTRSTETVQTSAKARLTSAAIWRISMN